MNRRTGFSLAAFAAILLLLSLFSLPSSFAQDRDDQDPPSRAGRVGYTQGTVSFQPGGEGDWLDAVPNRPDSSPPGEQRYPAACFRRNFVFPRASCGERRHF